MGGDRDGNPRVTAAVTQDVVYLSRLMVTNLYITQIEALIFDLSMWRASAELKQRAVEVCAGAKKHSGHYIEFWKDIPEHEPYRVVLGEVRDKLWNTRDHIQHLMARGHSEFSPQDIYTDPEQLMEPLELCYKSLCSVGDAAIADSKLLDMLRQVACFGLSLVRLDIRQEGARHTEALDAITAHLGQGAYSQWPEQQRLDWLMHELQSRRPLFWGGPGGGGEWGGARGAGHVPHAGGAAARLAGRIRHLHGHQRVARARGAAAAARRGGEAAAARGAAV
ncbi:hypothetical protein CLOM_g14782 [Closterium sp. NIES-68]|nr:hypothetical protein CLOM_g14782 [Closterium sp. NIES-68]